MAHKKIAFIYDAIYPYTKGGGEKRYYEIAKRLAAKGHSVHLYGMKFWTGPDCIRKNKIYLHGICPPFALYTRNGKRSIGQALWFGIHCLKLIKEDFDVIDCCGFPYFSLFTLKLVCWFKGKKLYSTWHEVWGQAYWRQYLGWLWPFGYLVEKTSIYLPNQIVAVSDSTARKIKYLLNYQKKIIVIPNGIDLDMVLRLKPSSPHSDVIYAGRLMDFKHLDFLIRSIAIVVKKNKKIQCLIIGDGPEKKKLELLTNKLNLKNNIRFLGFLEKQNDVYALMKSSKVFVLPSTREGFGMIALEANACGLPVITIKHQDNASQEIIHDLKNGFICRLKEKEIAKNIETVLDRDVKMNKKPPINKIIKAYDWDEIIEKLERFYQL
jgi:glycosyltransferase involved in cell wall biosynthesis